MMGISLDPVLNSAPLARVDIALQPSDELRRLRLDRLPAFRTCG